MGIDKAGFFDRLKRERELDMNYFAATFAKMETRDIQEFLRIAQNNLTSSTETVREVYREGIRGAATELLTRYREEMKNL